MSPRTCTATSIPRLATDQALVDRAPIYLTTRKGSRLPPPLNEIAPLVASYNLAKLNWVAKMSRAVIWWQ